MAISAVFLFRGGIVVWSQVLGGLVVVRIEATVWNVRVRLLVVVVEGVDWIRVWLCGVVLAVGAVLVVKVDLVSVVVKVLLVASVKVDLLSVHVVFLLWVHVVFLLWAHVVFLLWLVGWVVVVVVGQIGQLVLLVVVLGWSVLLKVWLVHCSVWRWFWGVVEPALEAWRGSCFASEEVDCKHCHQQNTDSHTDNNVYLRGRDCAVLRC